MGRNAKINYILLQVHYKYVLTDADNSGVDVMLTIKTPPKLAGKQILQINFVLFHQSS